MAPKSPCRATAGSPRSHTAAQAGSTDPPTARGAPWPGAVGCRTRSGSRPGRPVLSVLSPPTPQRVGPRSARPVGGFRPGRGGGGARTPPRPPPPRPGHPASTAPAAHAAATRGATSTPRAHSGCPAPGEPLRPPSTSQTTRRGPRNTKYPQTGRFVPHEVFLSVSYESAFFSRAFVQQIITHGGPTVRQAFG